MNTRMMQRIQAYMRNRGYDMPALVGKTSDWCYYTPDQDSYLPDQGW